MKLKSHRHSPSQFAAVSAHLLVVGLLRVLLLVAALARSLSLLLSRGRGRGRGAQRGTVPTALPRVFIIAQFPCVDHFQSIFFPN